MNVSRAGTAVFFGLLVACFSAGTALAQADAGGDREFLTFQVENDLFANVTNTDRHYTNGLQAAWLSRPQKNLPDWQIGRASCRERV